VLDQVPTAICSPSDVSSGVSPPLGQPLVLTQIILTRLGRPRWRHDHEPHGGRRYSVVVEQVWPRPMSALSSKMLVKMILESGLVREEGTTMF